MSGALIPVNGGGAAPARCVHCSALAVGPCARCREPVCGDCCVLTDGGARVWAICLSCERGGGRSLRSGWLAVIGWIAGPILALALLVAALAWFTGR